MRDDDGLAMLAVQLRTVADLIEQGKIFGGVLVFVEKRGDDDNVFALGKGLGFNGPAASAHCLLGGVTVIQHVLSTQLAAGADINESAFYDKEDEE